MFSPNGAAGNETVVAEEQPFGEIKESLKTVAGVLREAEIPFVLGGGLAAWAWGGPGTGHDLDVMVRPEDAERALEALEAAGMRTEKPPEGWLYKAWDGDVLVDVIFQRWAGRSTTTCSTGLSSWRSTRSRCSSCPRRTFW